MNLEDDYKADRSNGSGTKIGYTVEARSPHGPTLVNGNMIGDKWVKLEFSRGDKGVPNPGCYDSSGQMINCGLYSYASAQALRWWFHAAAEDEVVSNNLPLKIPMPRFGILTRIVRHEIKYQYTITATSAHQIIDDMLSPPREESANEPRDKWVYSAK